jgi:hypothetical protein
VIISFHLLFVHNIISSTRWKWQEACMGDIERCGNLRGKSTFGRPKCGWEDNTMTLQQVGWGDMDWIDLDQVSGGCPL